MSATLTASTSPARFWFSGNPRRKLKSLTTASGTQKVPTQFFFPKKLTPFFTPTPPSPWLRVVVGKRIRRTPR